MWKLVIRLDTFSVLSGVCIVEIRIIFFAVCTVYNSGAQHYAWHLPPLPAAKCVPKLMNIGVHTITHMGSANYT